MFLLNGSQAASRPASSRLFSVQEAVLSHPPDEPHVLFALSSLRSPYSMDWQYTRPPESLPVGIYNAGATCSLNSIIQALYFIPAFRNVIQSIDLQRLLPQESTFTGTSAVEGTVWILRSSTLALQKVFYLLEHSRNAVDLSPLLSSFNWNLADINQQVGTAFRLNGSETSTKC